MQQPNISYTILINGQSIALSSSYRMSHNTNYNTIAISFTPDIGLANWYVRLTPRVDDETDSYGPYEGMALAHKTGLSAGAAVSKTITFEAGTEVQTSIVTNDDGTSYTIADGNYRLSLYAQSATDGSWDATSLFMSLSAIGASTYYTFVPTDSTGMEVVVSG